MGAALEFLGSPRRGSNPRPSDYESKRLRPACAAQTRPGCSRQRGRPASTLQTCRVMAGGMTTRMTRLSHGSPTEPWPPSDRAGGRSSTGEPTCRWRLMAGQQLPTEIGWQGEQGGRGLTLNASSLPSAHHVQNMLTALHTLLGTRRGARLQGRLPGLLRRRDQRDRVARRPGLPVPRRPATTTRRHATNGPARRPAAGQGNPGST